MKGRNLFLLMMALLFLSVAATEVMASPPVAPTMNLQVLPDSVRVSWNTVADADGYTLFYAPYPSADPISSIDMGTATTLTAGLPVGAAYYVAIQSRNIDGNSPYSNIEHFTITGTMSNTSLQGGYYAFDYESDMWGAFSSTSFNGKGNLSFSNIVTTNGQPETGTGTYMLDPDGKLTIADGNNPGVVSRDGRFAAIANIESGTVGMTLMVQAATGMNEQKLQGDYYGLEVNEFNHGSFSVLNFNGAGIATHRTLHDADGSSHEADPATNVTVSDDGKIVILQGDDPFLHGAATEDAKVIVLADITSENSPGISLFVKKSSGLDNSVLSGKYYYVEVYGNTWACMGEADCDGNGSCSFNRLADFRNQGGSGTFQYNVSPDGSMLSTGENNRQMYGAVTENGEIFGFVGFGAPENNGISVFVRKTHYEN